jgi:hypothetical protein
MHRKPKLVPKVGTDIGSVLLTSDELGNALKAVKDKQPEFKHHWLEALSGGLWPCWKLTQEEIKGNSQRYGVLIWGELVKQCPGDRRVKQLRTK